MRWSFTGPLLAALATLPSTSLGSPYGPPPVAPRSNGRTCEVKALGNKQDDVPNILKAFETCNHGGKVVFPEGQNYWIGQKLNPVLSHVKIEWRGVWTLSDNLTYWRDNDNTYPIFFQNHHAGVVMSGDHIHINAYGTGGIFGNGNTWYDAEEAASETVRPMPFVWWNVTEVMVEHFFVKDPPQWSINLMNVTNAWFDDIYVNATAVNAPYGANWLSNTDGFDTMDCYNIKLTNMVYQGGDDCIAIKPRSYNIYVQNVTIHGGNGVAIGSLGQYKEDSSVKNVIVRDVNVLTNNNDMHNCAYIKTWIGASILQSNPNSAGLPNGAGWGVVQNIRFENFYIQGAASGPTISGSSGDNGSYAGTSLLEVSNIVYTNFTGWTTTGKNTTVSISCSNVHPCYNIVFQNVSLANSQNSSVLPAAGNCAYVAPRGIIGLAGNGCT